MDPPEGINMKQDPVVFNIEIGVEEENGIATVRCPEELRITERVASALKQAMDARGLELKRWVLTEKQQEDLIGLSNVVMGKNEETQRDKCSS